MAGTPIRVCPRLGAHHLTGAPVAPTSPVQPVTPADLVHSFDKGMQAGNATAGAVPPPTDATSRSRRPRPPPPLAWETFPSTRPHTIRRRPSHTQQPPTRPRHRRSSQDQPPPPHHHLRARYPLTPPTYGRRSPRPLPLFFHRAHHSRRCRVLHLCTPRRGKGARPSPRSCVKRPRPRLRRRRRVWEPRPSRPPPPARSPEPPRPTPPRGCGWNDWWPQWPANNPGWPGRLAIARTTRRC